MSARQADFGGPDSGDRLEILCEDGPLLAVNKPNGVITQGAPHGVLGLGDLVKRYLKEKYNKPGAVYLGVPHRLDRPVSGVVVFSRNSKCAARLSEQFAQRQVRKRYLALLERAPAPAEGRLEDWIYRIPDHSRVEIAPAEFPGAKLGHLTYRTRAVVRGRALVEIELGTGRMHQIRIQFASRGCPIMGDEQYGGRNRAELIAAAGLSDVIALHAAALTLRHPVRYDELTIRAQAPSFWRKFGWDADDLSIRE